MSPPDPLNVGASTGSARPASLGEVAPAGPIRHGTLNAYNYRECRCDRCRKANRDHQRLRSGPGKQLTADEAKYCQVCGVRTNIHPMKACWREIPY